MRKIIRPTTPGFYLIPKVSNRRLFGIKPLHCYHCGDVGTSELLYVIWVDVGDSDGDCNRQESFDFPVMDCERLLGNSSVKATEVRNPDNKKLKSVKKKLEDDTLEGMAEDDMINKNMKSLSEGYVGETWAEVMLDNPTWLIETLTVDAEGNEYTSVNIKEPKLRGQYN